MYCQTVDVVARARRAALLLAAFALAPAAGAASTNLTAAAASGYAAIDLYPLSIPSGFSAITLAQGGNATYGGATVGYGTTTGNSTHAIYWSPSGVATDFHPVNLTGFVTSYLNATHGSLQVGYGAGSTTGNNNHALIWNGTANATDVNPAGFVISQATGASNTRAVGYGFTPAFDIHAILWNGTTGSDINPAGYNTSFAYGVDDATSEVVGYGSGPSTSSANHALLWNTATSIVTDLHPSNLAGFSSSTAYGVGGGEEVGYGFGTGTAFHSHALLWHDSNIATDLNPAGFTDSTAYATDGLSQVGFGLDANGVSHALLWTGTPLAVDLQAALPATFTSSAAYGIDALGNVFGTATDANNNPHAVEWVLAVPEPGTTLWLGAAAVVPLLRRRRRGAR